MRSAILTLTLTISTVLFAACGGGAAPAATSAPSAATAAPQANVPAGDPAKGKDKFMGTCSACHGPDAKGIQGLGKNLVTSEFAKGLSDADLIAFVKKGRPTSDPLNTTGVDMPPRGGNPALTDQDLADIVAYVRTLEK